MRLISRVFTLAYAIFLVCLQSCSANQIDEQSESWNSNISLEQISPTVITQGSQLKVIGRGFVGVELGTSRLILSVRDQVDPVGALAEVSALLEREDQRLMTTTLSSNTFAQICPFSSVNLVGTALVETVSTLTNKVHRTEPINLSLTCHRQLNPTLLRVPFQAIHLNDTITLEGDGLLFGGEEGETTAVVSGCIVQDRFSNTCATDKVTLDQISLLVKPSSEDSRDNPSLVIGPSLMGLDSGFFSGRVFLRNTFSQGGTSESDILDFNVEVLPSLIDSVNVSGNSLGGYVDFIGSGFVGLDPLAITTILIDGQYEPNNGMNIPIREEIVTQYDSPNRVRYVLNEEDSLGQTLKLRKGSGVMVGQFTPILSYGSTQLELPSLYSAFEIKPIRQMVFANFLPGFDDALERFGLLDAAEIIKDLIIQRSTAIFGGIGVEIRKEPPDDFALYSQVDLTGFDPNGIGLMGYDNTPGKDVGNERLYDRIGGVHALTQEDGYPGYGGIFVESFFGFSKRPPTGIEPHPGASGSFDQIFNRLRPESGRPVSRSEVRLFAPIPSHEFCLLPNIDRQTEVNCGILVFSWLIAGTMAHEIAHSLGLADPEGSLFHNPQTAPNHIMDAGGERPFEERAGLIDELGEYFCQENYEYLRAILPTSLPDPLNSRTACY